MPAFVPGILVLFFSALAFYMAFRFYRKQDSRGAITMIVIGGFVLRLFLSLDLHLREWDERYHALVAKNLMEDPLKPVLYKNPVLEYDHQNWVRNHVWLAKPPVPLWFMSAGLSVFGINEIALRIPSILFSCLGIYLMFILGKYLYNEKTGLLAAFLYAINGMLLEISSGRISSDHVETFFNVFVLGSAVFSFLILKFPKRHLLFSCLAGFFFGMAFLSKWYPAFIVVPIFISILVFGKTFSIRQIIWSILIFMGISLITVMPWMLYIYNTFPEETSYMLKALLEPVSSVIQGHEGNFWFYFDVLRIVFGEIIYLPLIWFLYKTFKESDYRSLTLNLWWILPLIIFSFSETKRGTYLLVSAPSIFIITAVFFLFLLNYLKGKKHEWFYKLIMIALIALPVRYSIERLKPFVDRDFNPAWAQELRSLRENISFREKDKVLVFNINKPIDAMFYSGLTVYEEVPGKGKLEELEKQGYQIIINDPESLYKDWGFTSKNLYGNY